jgi:seryl-tRNA synthetase
MFESFRQALSDFARRGASPDDRRSLLAEMKATLIRAKAGVHDLREALELSRRRLEGERRELDTVRRRHQLASDIGDRETVVVAERFVKHHSDRIAVLEQKIDAQQAELALVEAEVGEMTTALKSAMAGAVPIQDPDRAERDALEELERDLEGPNPGPELDALRRSRMRADREEEAARRLDELKRRMGK